MPDTHEKMDALRAQYERIAPPAELNARLERAMSAARPPVRVLWGRYFVRAVLAAALALAAAANVSAAAAEALSTVPFIGAFTRLVTFRNYTDDRGNTEAQIETPHVSGLDSAELERQLNERFDQYADALISRYESDLASLGDQGHESIYSAYDVIADSSRQLTVALHTVITEAGAQQINAYYTIDKRAGKIVALQDLFQPGADYVTPVSAEIRRQMQAQMESGEGKAYFLDPEDPAAFREISADQQFYVNPEGRLVISFDEYDVAPGYMGAVSFEIPAGTVASILSPDSLVR